MIIKPFQEIFQVVNDEHYLNVQLNWSAITVKAVY